MSIEKYLLTVVACVPQRTRYALLGSRSAPSRLAEVIHTLLNRLPVGRYPVLDCQGPLKGFRMRVDWKKHRAFAYGTWEPEVVEAMSHCVRNGMTALDLGAQSGFYSLLLSKLVGRAGNVVAFEPLPANLRILKENIAINGLTNVVIRSEAVTDKPGALELQVPAEGSDILAGPLAPDDRQHTVIVPATSLDVFIDEIGRPVDFVKMDVEGAEDAVLDGARKVLNRYHPTMLVELHSMDGHNREHAVVSSLQGMGYGVEWLGEVSWTAHILARWARA